ncbi:MAG: helix-turn-helix domain-containing protein [Micropepsaceae bacterium]
MARRTAEAAAQTRAAIVAAARELFAKHGFSATTTSEVASRAGVTVGALFHHFTDKVDLFIAVFDELDAEMDAHARERARTFGGVKGFLEGFRAFLEFAQNQDYHRIVLAEAPVVLSDKIWKSRDKLRGLSTIMQGVEALISSGEIPVQPAKPLAILLLGAMNESGFALARNEAGVTVSGCVHAMERLLKGGRAG